MNKIFILIFTLIFLPSVVAQNDKGVITDLGTFEYRDKDSYNVTRFKIYTIKRIENSKVTSKNIVKTYKYEIRGISLSRYEGNRVDTYLNGIQVYAKGECVTCQIVSDGFNVNISGNSKIYTYYSDIDNLQIAIKWDNSIYNTEF